MAGDLDAAAMHPPLNAHMTVGDRNVDKFIFSFADFLGIQLKFVSPLDGNMSTVFQGNPSNSC